MKKDELKNRLNRMEDAIREEERYFQKEIEDILAETQTTTEKIFQMKHKGVEVENTKKQFQKTLAELAEEHEKLVSEYNKIKDDPGRQDSKIKTASDTLQTANKTLRETEDEIKEKEKILNAEKATIEGVRRKIAEVVKVSQAEDKKLEELTKNRMNLEVEKAERTDDKTGLLMDKAAKEDMLKGLHKEFRNKLESNNKTKVEVDKLKKEIRALENDRNKQSNAIREDEMALAKMVKEKAEVRSKKEKLVSTIRGLQIEQKLLIDKKDILKNEGEKVLSEVRKHEMSIEEQKKKLLDLKATEADGLKNIKSLTTFREITARKASGANAEVRATKEELKIKELQMLDLTKRQQEIEFKLNSFKTLYEEVKSARNKYVNEIQSSSQQLAELKQRIKIAQNELEISKNESVEKEKSLLKLMGSTKKQIHERDKKRAKLNKSEFEKQKLIEQGNQQANQIAKLNMITLSLQGDMLEIRKHYESACESRNYMGVQLIDRNDELCILYEKTNVQESIIKNGEAEIAKVEDEIRMIKIEIKEVERKIEASRKKAPEIPKLASKVVQLNQELQAELAKEEKLSEELENIENSDRWREIKGEEPDPEALKAKIQVLEEKLNSKKESLLEKELILDEVTNISENLRKQSIESRRPTLELTSKVNELQARLKATTRKMMATISELSMFQANVIKLESEKTELYNYLDSIRERAQKGLPPTDESEIEFLKILRDKKRYLEMREEKLEMEMVRNSMAPFTINSTAVERFNAYVDELGLPRPYGFFRPFQPSQLGANLRHFKRPEPRQIQI